MVVEGGLVEVGGGLVLLAVWLETAYNWVRARGQPRANGSRWVHIERRKGKVIVGVEDVGGSASAFDYGGERVEVEVAHGVGAVCG